MRITILMFSALGLALAAACSDDGDDAPVPDAGFVDVGSSTVDDDAGFSDETDGGQVTGDPDTGVESDAGFAGDAGAPDLGPDAGIDTACDPTFFPDGACGGPLTGTWVFQEVCGEDTAAIDAFLMSCDATVVSQIRTVTGTLTVGALSPTGSYEFDAVIDGLIVLEIGATCLSTAGGCSAVGDFLNMFIDATCSTVGVGACQCDVTTRQPLGDNGAIQPQGTTFTTEGGDITTYDYCVSGGALRFREQGTSTTLVLSP